jgi:hypothetical protein
LLEDKVGCELAHQLEQVAQAWSDFELIFRDAVDRVLYESFDVHRFNAHIIGAYVTLEQRRSGYRGRQFKYDDIRILQLNTRLREGMERGFGGAVSPPLRGPSDYRASSSAKVLAKAARTGGR